MPRRGTAPPSESQRQIQTLRRTTMTQSVAACRRLSFSGPYLSFFLNLANLIPTTSNQIEHISEAPLLIASLRRPRPGVSLNGVKSSGKHKTLRLTFRLIEIGLNPIGLLHLSERPSWGLGIMLYPPRSIPPDIALGFHSQSCQSTMRSGQVLQLLDPSQHHV